MKQSFLGARKELRQSVASMESCLDVLTEIDNKDQPFDIAHLDMVKHIVPSDHNVVPMYDLNTSMEGLRESIKSSRDKIKDLVNRFKQRNRPVIYELKTPDAMKRIREDLSKWKGEAIGWVSIPYQYSGYEEPAEIIAAFEQDLKILESMVKTFRPMYDEMSKLSAQLCDEIDSEDADEDLIDELDGKIHDKLIAAKSKIESIPRRSNGETFRVQRHRGGVEVETIGTNKRWLSNVREDDPVYVKACNAQQAETLLGFIDRATKVIESLPSLTTDYAQGELIWMMVIPFAVQDHIRSSFVHIEASINQKGRTTVSKESDVANSSDHTIEENPLLLIGRKLMQRDPLSNNVIKLNTTHLSSGIDQSGTDVLATVKRSLPWFLVLAKGTASYAKAIQNAIDNNVDVKDVDLQSHFPALCKDEGTDLSLTYTIQIADSIFSEIYTIRVARDRNFGGQFDLQAMEASDISRCLKYVEQISTVNPQYIKCSDPQIDKDYLELARNALIHIQSFFIPELTKWMLASFGDPL